MIGLLTFENVNWKTKVGSLQAIGNLALGAPKMFLKDIVPEVVKSFSDTHKNVLAEARSALRKISKVITNPEIVKHVRQITIALSDATKVRDTLSLIANTSFMNEIDPASLSLIMPIIEKGLKSKSIDVKIIACKAIEVVAGFTDSDNMLLYFDRLLPSYGASLFDSIPEVRNTAAEGLGRISSFLGAENSTEVINWLKGVLQSDCSGIERLGATYAYSQMIPHINWDLHEIISFCNHPSTHIRESYLELLSYLPTSKDFLDNFEMICEIMYENISHSSTEVREASVKVMTKCIKFYSKTHLDVIIHPLEEGLFSDNWRTR
jgi:hypothetical protein